jgi:hypothetical protein
MIERGLSRHQAANYIGIKPSLFDILVVEGRMPTPTRINSRTVWDIRLLDEAFDDLKNVENNPWDKAR